MDYLKYISIILISTLFLLFGVHLLIAAYHLTDPFSFVLTFFASNLIILISAALGLGFAIRLKRLWQGVSQAHHPADDGTDSRESPD